MLNNFLEQLGYLFLPNIAQIGGNLSRIYWGLVFAVDQYRFGALAGMYLQHQDGVRYGTDSK